jgi:hypothetical protein
MDIPYSVETLREAVSLLQEEAAIEGDGSCRAIRKSGGVTGCVVTPLTIGSAPLLLYLAMGSLGNQVFVSETRNIHKFKLNLLPMEDCDSFDLIQDRGSERRLFEDCKIHGFELRIGREETLKLKLDITGDRWPVVYPHIDAFTPEKGERFSSDGVTYKINGQKYSNIYGLTLAAKKESGTITEIWIKRILNNGPDIPELIEELSFTAQLFKDSYEARYFGTFTITAKRLVLTADETSINSAGAVIGPLRYYIAGSVQAEVFSSTDIHVG